MIYVRSKAQSLLLLITSFCTPLVKTAKYMNTCTLFIFLRPSCGFNMHVSINLCTLYENIIFIFCNKSAPCAYSAETLFFYLSMSLQSKAHFDFNIAQNNLHKILLFPLHTIDTINR